MKRPVSAAIKATQAAPQVGAVEARHKRRVIANVAVARELAGGAGPSPPRYNRNSHGR